MGNSPTGVAGDLLSAVTIGVYKVPYNDADLKKLADGAAMDLGYANTSAYERFLNKMGDKLPNDWFSRFNKKRGF